MNEDPTYKSITKELFSPGYWERARERRRASKTWWDVAFLPVAFGAIGLFWFGFYKFSWWVHVQLFPQDAGHIERLIGPQHLTRPQFLMIIMPIFGAIPLGFIASNFAMMLVPWARRASEEKAKGVKWANYRDAQTALLKLASIMVSISVASGIAGAIILGSN